MLHEERDLLYKTQDMSHSTQLEQQLLYLFSLTRKMYTRLFAAPTSLLLCVRATSFYFLYLSVPDSDQRFNSFHLSLLAIQLSDLQTKIV